MTSFSILMFDPFFPHLQRSRCFSWISSLAPPVGAVGGHKRIRKKKLQQGHERRRELHRCVQRTGDESFTGVFTEQLLWSLNKTKNEILLQPWKLCLHVNMFGCEEFPPQTNPTHFNPDVLSTNCRQNYTQSSKWRKFDLDFIEFNSFF